MIKEILLAPITWLYTGVIMLRNYLYKTKALKSTHFNVPVICVGNLSTGGTGKTPHTNYLINLIKPNYKVGVLSRGYKRKTNGYIEVEINSKAENVGDEPLFYKFKHPNAKVAVCEDRVFGISAMAQNQEDPMVYLLDDAFQHRAIKADLNIIITDYNKLYTRDKLLPAGRLREPISGAKRADIIIVSKCPPLLSKTEKNKIKLELKPEKYQHIFFSSIAYLPLYSLFNQELINFEKQKTVLIVSGIANPIPLEKEIEKSFETVYIRQFPDHHNYKREDIESIIRTYENLDEENKIIITTEKDATRLLVFKNYFEEKNIKVFCLPISVNFDEQEKEAFDKAIKHYLSITLPLPEEPEDIIINYDYKD
ncbi:MAG: tetraacyldisaccharide 4'-kinase [Chitinophagales bacterium]